MDKMSLKFLVMQIFKKSVPAAGALLPFFTKRKDLQTILKKQEFQYLLQRDLKGVTAI